jgi:hypothetical protein
MKLKKKKYFLSSTKQFVNAINMFYNQKYINAHFLLDFWWIYFNLWVSSIKEIGWLHRFRKLYITNIFKTSNQFYIAKIVLATKVVTENSVDADFISWIYDTFYYKYEPFYF